MWIGRFSACHATNGGKWGLAKRRGEKRLDVAGCKEEKGGRGLKKK